MMCLTTKPYKHLQNTRTAFYAIICFLLLNITPAMAASSYTVENIQVDVTAGNAVEAREKAFEDAQIKGYKMLAEKFLSVEEMKELETPDIEDVSIYVKDFEVSKEKLSATRYSGVYKIRYSARAFAKAGNQAMSKGTQGTNARPQRGEILVFPFFEDGGYPMLWKANPFMQAWLRARDGNRAAPAIVPKGDTQDISLIRDNQALRYNADNLETLKKRYRATQAAVLMAVPERMPDGNISVAVGIYQAKSYGPELSRQISVRGIEGEGVDRFYDRVVKAVNDVFRQSWKRKTAVQQVTQNQRAPLTGPVHTMVSQIEFSTMRQWVDAKRAMERSYGVSTVSVKSLSPRSATVTINYQGSVDNLRQELYQNGLALNDPLTQSGGIYKIKTRL